MAVAAKRRVRPEASAGFLPILSDIVPRAPAFASPEATFLRVADNPLEEWGEKDHKPALKSV